MKNVLGVSDFFIEPGNGPLALHGDDQPLFSGICREDLTYINDLYKKGQDRNLFFQAVGFELKND